MNWLVLGGSVVAILALAGTAKLLGLGAWTLDEASARQAAADTLPDFEPSSVVIAEDGASATVRSIDGRTASVHRHGAHAVARELGQAGT